MNSENSAVFMGASVMDLITYTQRFPVPGETVSGKEFRKGTGGKAANACIMSAKIGLSSSMIAKIGDDVFGHEMLENFRKHKINTQNILLTKELFTSTAAICVTDDGENSIIYVPGPSNLLTSDEIRKASDSIFAKCKLFVTTFECVPKTLETALTIAKEKGVMTLVNSAPPFPEPFSDNIYKLCDILCLNETEAQNMTGIEINCTADGQTAMKWLLDKGCASVILTMGVNGALYFDKTIASPIHIPIEKKVIPIDTTGAGDAFVGSLAYYLVSHPELSIKEKIRRSCIIASYSVLKQGTQSSYPWKDELPNDLFI